jgi:transposase
VSEVLDYRPASFRVIRHVRVKFSCRACETITQAPAPSLPIRRGRASAALLAHMLTAKFCDHLPLYRQSDIYARAGAALERSTFADWVGQVFALLRPLIDALQRHVIASDRLHADDTTVPVLAPGTARPRRDRFGRICVMSGPMAALDRRRCAITTVQIAARCTHDHTLHPFRGVLQADGYTGFDGLYADGHIVEAACSLQRVSGRSDIAGAIRYALSRWPALTRCLVDGRVAIDNNAVERAIRPFVLGRKNRLLAGSDAGGERATATTPGSRLIQHITTQRASPAKRLRSVVRRVFLKVSRSSRRKRHTAS